MPKRKHPADWYHLDDQSITLLRCKLQEFLEIENSTRKFQLTKEGVALACELNPNDLTPSNLKIRASCIVESLRYKYLRAIIQKLDLSCHGEIAFREFVDLFHRVWSGRDGEASLPGTSTKEVLDYTAWAIETFRRCPSRASAERLEMGWRRLAPVKFDHLVILEAGAHLARWYVYQERYSEAVAIAETLITALASVPVADRCSAPLIHIIWGSTYVMRHSPKFHPRHAVANAVAMLELAEEGDQVIDVIFALREQLKARSAWCIGNHCKPDPDQKEFALDVARRLMSVVGEEHPRADLEVEWIHTCAVITECLLALGYSKAARQMWERLMTCPLTESLVSDPKNIQIRSKVDFCRPAYHIAIQEYAEARSAACHFLKQDHNQEFRNRCTRQLVLARAVDLDQINRMREVWVSSLVHC